MATPPPLPAETLERILRVATLDGRMLMVIAGLFALMSAAGHDGIGAVAGCLGAGAGAVELHGVGLLRSGESRGLAWLVRSQFFLMAALLLYAAARLWTFDVEPLRAGLAASPQARTMLENSRVTEEQFLAFSKNIFTVLYVLVGLATVIYQGAMARYYYRRREAVSLALHEHASRTTDWRESE